MLKVRFPEYAEPPLMTNGIEMLVPKFCSTGATGENAKLELEMLCVLARPVKLQLAQAFC
jgi:hypothetical protein